MELEKAAFLLLFLALEVLVPVALLALELVVVAVGALVVVPVVLLALPLVVVAGAGLDVDVSPYKTLAVSADAASQTEVALSVTPAPIQNPSVASSAACKSLPWHFSAIQSVVLVTYCGLPHKQAASLAVQLPKAPPQENAQVGKDDIVVSCLLEDVSIGEA